MNDADRTSVAPVGTDFQELAGCGRWSEVAPVEKDDLRWSDDGICHV